MNNLQDILSAFVIENKKGSYKDFGLKDASEYPLAGLTYFADYGYLPGYVGEDDADLDFLIGDDENGTHGYFLVWRTEEVPEEHKFFLNMTDAQLAQTLKEYGPVLVGDKVELTVTEVLEQIKPFKV